MTVWVYLIRCVDGTLYTGVTNDLDRRFKQHNGLLPGGAKYTRSRRPVELVCSHPYLTRSEAMREERRIKRLSKSQKESYAANFPQ